MSRSWWWRAVSRPEGKEHGLVIAKDEKGEPTATLPYQIVRRGPVSAILMPQLTQTGHIWTAPAADRPEAMIAMCLELKRLMRRERCIMAQVADYLAPEEIEILRSEGFEIEERVSYRIEPDDIEAVINRFHSDKRRNYRKAKGLTLDTGMTPDELYTAIETSYGKVFYSREIFTTLAAEAIRHDSGVILRAHNAGGDAVSALLLTFDSHFAYHMAYAATPSHERDGSLEWLTVRAMEYAFARGLTFDFEGSIVPGIARSYRHFGGVAAHYVFATRYANPLVKSIVKILKRK